MKTYQIHLIRNGRTDDSTSGRYIGHTDAILSPEGVAELHRLKEQADYPYVEAVFTSPLKRCTQTAHAIYPEREAIVMRELIEYDFGEYEGKTPEQLADDEGFASWPQSRPSRASVQQALISIQNSSKTPKPCGFRGFSFSDCLPCFGIV